MQVRVPSKLQAVGISAQIIAAIPIKYIAKCSKLWMFANRIRKTPIIEFS
jgi:hypothetical protein